MYYTYFQIGFGAEMARKNILLHGENVHCFHNTDNEIRFAPHNAILPDFDVKDFARLAKERPDARRLPLADLETARVRVDEKGSLAVRLELPEPGTRVWRHAIDFGKRVEIETKNVIEIQGGWALKGSGISRNTVEFTVDEDDYGYSAFSIESGGWHRQLAFEWQPRNRADKTPPRIRRRAAALSLLDGDSGKAREDGTMALFLRMALIAGIERWLEVQVGKSIDATETIEYLADKSRRQFLEDVLAWNLPEMRPSPSLYSPGQPVLQEYKRQCLEQTGATLPVVSGSDQCDIAGFYKDMMHVLKTSDADNAGPEALDRTVIAFWKAVTG